MLFGNVVALLSGVQQLAAHVQSAQQLTKTVHLRVLNGRCRNVFDLKI